MQANQENLEHGSPAAIPPAARPRRHRARALLMLATTAGAVAFGVIPALGGQAAASTAAAVMAESQAQRWDTFSNNWSGYVLTEAQTGTTYTSAAASWVVPAVSSPGNGRPGCVSNWTGIGGATPGDPTLVQLGTEGCAGTGGSGYEAWYETLPAPSTPIPSLSVRPGDRVVASLALVRTGPSLQQPSLTGEIRRLWSKAVAALRSVDPRLTSSAVVERVRQLLSGGVAQLRREGIGSALERIGRLAGAEASLKDLEHLVALKTGSHTSTGPETWRLGLTVTSPDGSTSSWSTEVSYRSSLASVEWITEAPTVNGAITALPDYGIARFVGLAADGSSPVLTASDAVVMTDHFGEVSVPSPAYGTYDPFNTCWFASVREATTCPATAG